MHLGRRDRVPFPDSYKNFRVMRAHGRMLGIPRVLDPDNDLYAGYLFKHPALLSAATLDELRAMIDAFDESSAVPEVVGHCDGYDVVRLGDRLYGVPGPAPKADLHLAAERARVGAIPAADVDALKEAVARAKASVPVEFAGWLPIFEFAGNCGAHPQFKHTDSPPPGFRFTCSAPPPSRRESRLARAASWLTQKVGKVVRGGWAMTRPVTAFLRPHRGVGARARLRVFGAMARLFATLVARGCKPLASLRFLQSRHLHSQLLLGDHRGPVFLTSMPFTFGQNPWVIEIEDPTTLFFPMIQNGNTAALDVAASPHFGVVKTLLESDQCKAILTHMKSTAELVPTLFGSEAVAKKVVYAPLGVTLPARHQRHEPRPDDEPIDLLFINSWCQVPSNFYLRGGLDILEAFATLKVRYPQLRLTLRTALPTLDDHYHRIIESGWVRVINRFMTAEEMAELHARSDIYLLPAARVHIVSLLQAMSYGLAVVASDGWGIEEYLENERNGLVVKGRYGKTSWADTQAGLLREDYEPMYTPDPEVVAGIVEAVSRLVEDRQLRARLGREARHDVATRYTTEQWNRALAEALGRAVPPGAGADDESVRRAVRQVEAFQAVGPSA